MIENLPKNWEIAKLDEVVDVLDRMRVPINAKERAQREGNVPYYGSTGQVGWIDGHLFNEELVLLGEDGAPFYDSSKQKSYIIRGKSWVNNHAHVLRARNGIPNSYIKYYLDLFDYHGYVTGTTRLKLNQASMKTIPVPIAPPEQQKRIVAEIEKQFSRLDEAVVNLKRVKANLKRYKAAVLKAAVEGKLTEEWRKQHPDVESASKLLERILTERREKWEAAELVKMKAKGKLPKDDRWKKKYIEPILPDREELSEIPEGWIWLTPELLAADEDNAICAGPFGTIFKAKDFRPKGIPIIFLRHVAPGKYLTHKPGFMDVEKWEELFQPYSVYGGELLITKLGEPPGVCAIYPEGIGPAMVTPDVMKMSVNESYTVSHFLMHFFNSQLSRDSAASLAFGTTRLRLTLPIFRALSVPVPSLAEQNKIVVEVSKEISTIESLDEMCEKNLLRADSLKQSILNKAFSGQLVQPEPGDEPASVLLDRIRKKMVIKTTPPKKRKILSGKRRQIVKSSVATKRTLIEVLKEHPDGITPESLLLSANYTFDEVDCFYTELVKIGDKISEEKPSGNDALAWPHENKVFLRLRSE